MLKSIDESSDVASDFRSALRVEVWEANETVKAEDDAKIVGSSSSIDCNCTVILLQEEVLGGRGRREKKREEGKGVFLLKL